MDPAQGPAAVEQLASSHGDRLRNLLFQSEASSSSKAIVELLGFLNTRDEESRAHLEHVTWTSWARLGKALDGDTCRRNAILESACKAAGIQDRQAAPIQVPSQKVLQIGVVLGSKGRVALRMREVQLLALTTAWRFTGRELQFSDGFDLVSLATRLPSIGSLLVLGDQVLEESKNVRILHSSAKGKGEDPTLQAGTDVEMPAQDNQTKQGRNSHDVHQTEQNRRFIIRDNTHGGNEESAGRSLSNPTRIRAGRKRKAVPHTINCQFSGEDDDGGDMMDEDCRGNEALNDRSEVQDPLGALGFQTAGMKLKSELAQKGRSMKGVGRGAGALGSTQGMGGYAPRTGLSRPKGGQGNVVSGLRGGFVPPFVRKAVNALGGQDTSKGDNPMSAKMLQLLAGPDGELPESLQKFDPALIDMVCNEVLDEGAAVDWEDIAGQDAAKQLIQEIVVWPMMNPTLFMGARAPPKGILLFGPPGTGKTLLGKAIASNIKATFFNISASSLTSKWIGEGEKMVRTLFAVAEFMQPSVIFIDEIDSILSARKSEGEHEASRRLKTELLVQMEGCNPNSLSRRILLVGATNRPEELDEAARRRMPKQLYIPLPCEPARKEMILRQLGAVKSVLSQEDVQKVVQKTDGYSGADMRNLIQEALQGPVREAVRQHGSKIATLSESDLRPVGKRDFQMAAKAQKPSVAPCEVTRYEVYNAKHGAKYVGDGSSDDEW